ncbi:unnamed protein product, partial [Ixodes hexagonus]
FLTEGADVIAIDAFSKSVPDNLDIIIGIAFIRPGENQLQRHYLNIYSQSEPGCGLDLDRIAQGCQSLELNFIPYQLTHALLFPNRTNRKTGEFVFLLSGSDSRIHLFQEDVHQSYSEVPVKIHFPEFADVEDIVLIMSLKYVENETRRLSAIGCESGVIQVSVTMLNGNEIQVLSSRKVDLDSPVSVVQFFEDAVSLPLPEFLENGKLLSAAGASGAKSSRTHLLVGTTLGTSFVYRDILSRGFNAYAMLPCSEQFDSVTCGCIADIDMDGENEVILGTYGQEVLIYKLEHLPSGQEAYALSWQQTVSHPILSLRYLDLMGDGACELLVLSTKGLHILQHDLQETAQICIDRLRRVLELMNCKPEDAEEESQV